MSLGHGSNRVISGRKRKASIFTSARGLEKPRKSSSFFRLPSSRQWPAQSARDESLRAALRPPPRGRGEGRVAGASTPARWAASSKVHVPARPDCRSLLAAAAREESTDCGSRSHGESRVRYRRVGPGRPEAHGEPGPFSLREGGGGVGVAQGPAPTRTLESQGSADLFVRGEPFARACAAGVDARGREPGRTRGARSSSAGPLWVCNTVKKAWLYSDFRCVLNIPEKPMEGKYDLGVNQDYF